MNSVAALMRELHRLGIELQPRGDMIAYSPREAMTPDLLERLREHKPELLGMLRADPPPASPEAPSEPDLDPFVALVLATFPGSELVPDDEPPWESAPIFGSDEPLACRCCGKKQRWRLREGRPWVCPTCHPPYPEDQVEWLLPDSSNDGGPR